MVRGWGSKKAWFDVQNGLSGGGGFIENDFIKSISQKKRCLFLSHNSLLAVNKTCKCNDYINGSQVEKGRCTFFCNICNYIFGVKPPQEEVITEYVLGKDVFASLPTGFGKSICYGCLPIVFDKLRGLDEKTIALIITPLISLMTDQVSSFTSKGLKAGFIGTGMNKETVDVIMWAVSITFHQPRSTVRE